MSQDLQSLLDPKPGRWPDWAVFLACAAGIVAVSVADAVTGEEVMLTLFYLVPVSYGAWRLGRVAGLALALLCATDWLLGARGPSHRYDAAKIFNDGAELAFYLFTVVVVSGLARALRQERALARTDTLTGLWNRREFYTHVEAAQAALAAGGPAYTVLYLDLDGFKQVNDQRGHHAGDEVLLRVAGVLREAAARRVLPARLGGDEFAVLWMDGDGGAEALFQRLLDSLDAQGWGVGASAGELRCADPSQSVDEVVRRADALMYEVKRGGKRGLRRAALAAQA